VIPHPHDLQPVPNNFLFQFQNLHFGTRVFL
jgi:hypothetical protein